MHRGEGTPLDGALLSVAAMIVGSAVISWSPPPGALNTAILIICGDECPVWVFLTLRDNSEEVGAR